ncbi:MAG: hypothetical protein QGI14_00645 [Candidatus Poseidonia sp.]|jgi:hypothetical protein|nr:hypothetical protein [Poseidonia sp.]MEC7059176.1 hypothetical protein [Candidatus Thermoplasmatota archaeon]DAC57855.1 MAG TPA: hypothetical protein D7I08_05165 [Candidatus Poseidoniales archaeon]MEC7089390.1 hypothetical protein [Candidatus Thermoplasmatota archaeon]MEC8707490.1 hypothetical protein [Candidatus Thermoplasmatota archaeon]|tara:strand:- start:17391 stop:17732 length:342 start_codon:yes stop_codon:yes gene_type:complete
MLQRLLLEFLKVDGVNQATIIDDRGKLLSSVGPEGQLPPTEKVVNMTVAALDATQGHRFGDLQEIWVEGGAYTMIDIVTPYRIAMLSGEEGNIARWRHAMDHLRRQLATTQEL